MRRPLGTGIPFALTGDSNVDTIFDMNAQPAALQDQFVFLTLFAIIPDGNDSGTLTIDSVAGGTSRTLRVQNVSALVTTQTAGLACPKILDRFPLRGDAILQIENSGVPANQLVYLCGYIEVAGESEPPRDLRGLQPSNTLVTPFTSAPTEVSGIGGADTVHILENGYTDEITLFLRAGSTPVSPHLVISDGITSVDIDLGTAFGGDEEIPLKVLDGIPVQAQDAGGGISMYTTAANDVMMAWGYFNRR